MSDSPQKPVNGEEVLPLNVVPGLGGPEDEDTPRQVIDGGWRQCVASCCRDEHHRKLAISSIVCGCSCIGIKALINSVKAETTTDPEAAAKFSQQAKKFAIISIVTFVVILGSIPVLMALVSYLLTLRD